MFWERQFWYKIRRWNIKHWKLFPLIQALSDKNTNHPCTSLFSIKSKFKEDSLHQRAIAAKLLLVPLCWKVRSVSHCSVALEQPRWEWMVSEWDKRIQILREWAYRNPYKCWNLLAAGVVVIVLAFGCDEVHFKEYVMFGLARRTQLPKLFHSKPTNETSVRRRQN